ncbi:MAG: Bug family tripartite tricarboxylate transporter substrate binding protein [Aquabacterium sp.]
MARLKRRQWLALCAAGLAGRASAVGPWPAASLTLMLAYPPGGVTDRIARALVLRLRAALGVPVQMSYRPGAGGTLAMEALAQAPADGRLLCLNAATPLTLAPWLGRLRYDPLRDIAPIAGLMATPALVVGTPALVVGTPALAAPDWPAMLQAAAGQPGGLRWASSGIGTTGHLVVEQVRLGTGLPFVHVPYKGGGAQLQDALAGQFELLSTNLAAPQLQWVEQGRLQALALGAPQRHAALPELPTLAELGHPAASRGSVFGLFAPGRMPAAMRQRLHAALRNVLTAEDWQSLVRAELSLPLDEGPTVLAARLADESQSNRRLAQDPRFRA